MVGSKFKYIPRPPVTRLLRLAACMSEEKLLLDINEAQQIKDQLIKLGRQIPEFVEHALQRNQGSGRPPCRWSFADYFEIQDAKEEYEQQIRTKDCGNYEKIMEHIAANFKVAGHHVGVKRWEQFFSVMRNVDFEDKI